MVLVVWPPNCLQPSLVRHVSRSGVVMNGYEERFNELPDIPSPSHDLMWDVRPKAKQYNKSVRTSMDGDMFQAIQDLLMNKNLPYAGDISAFGRDAWASKIESLEKYLSKDGRTLWSALQAEQRRLTAERYVVVIKDHVKVAAELLVEWTLAEEWDAVVADLEHARAQVEEFPVPAWRRRVAKEWLSSQAVQNLLEIWQVDMDQGALERVNKVWSYFQRVSEAG